MLWLIIIFETFTIVWIILSSNDLYKTVQYLELRVLESEEMILRLRARNDKLLQELDELNDSEIY